ncbi:Protein of unknown function [Actinokineospora alba]|uniref:DUF3040 domain-containing protein n=1 Tax=Actinokineospora alba TaxID=504798 RepID=A0A1H0VQ10_9PSEU|nr:DUF3040 domain-containing protein [Actinokineospora alba]TDP70183.1 hypothetical protein C8E96_5785 [Actinokineospora alba]SDI37276.1 Protein of unknown function [Actinokineospora alba]SDP80424.1 Protein of unknown function [Actinokineospora alba]
MLSMGDRRRLDEIESLTRAADPDFADGLRDWDPVPPRDDRRAPVVALGIGTALVLLVATLAGNLVVMLVAFIGLVCAVVRYRGCVRRSHLWSRDARWRPRW